MVAKLTIGLLLAMGLFVGGQQWRSNQELKERARRGRVPVAIEDARARNQTEVTLRAPIAFHAAVKDLNEALANYTTMIAEPVAHYTQVSPDSKEIETWYKLKVTEFLSEPKNSQCSQCPKPEIVPAQLQPIQPDEIIIVRNTGSITSDGVRVSTIDPEFPDFEDAQKYLFFTSLDPHTRIASLALGPSAVSIVREREDRLDPVSERRGKLTAELMRRYVHLTRLKNELRFKRFPD